MELFWKEKKQEKTSLKSILGIYQAKQLIASKQEQMEAKLYLAEHMHSCP